MALHYLIFEASDDGEGNGSWEAMASVRQAQLADARTEASAVMAAAERDAPGPRGPMDEGGLWDMDLQIQDEGEWTRLTLTLVGPWEWGEALLEQLTGDDA